jgi:hypothetical protein
MLFGLCGAALLPVASAQESIHYASVSGRVTDPQGAAVAGVDVTARHTQTNIKAAAVTDPDGRFRFPFLKVGPYELVVAKQGLRSVSRSLSLNVGAAFQLPIVLTVGGEETVTVDEAPALETARSQIAGQRRCR